MLITWRTVSRGILAGLCLLGPTVQAQNDAASRREAIEGMYPVMLAALQAKNFGRARNICDQAITWEPQNPVHHYNLACIEAQAGGPRLPRAWGALELAVALGFNDAEHLRTDPDLEPLRSDPKFADILGKIVYNSTAGAAIAAIRIPDANPAKSNGPSAALPAEPSAKASLSDESPVGLFLMFRYSSATQTLERAAWYFAPDRTVYRGLREGFSNADLAAHRDLKGTANRIGRALEISWASGEKSTATFERDGNGFLWDMAIFTPATPFENPADLVGAYEGSETIPAGSKELPVAQRIELRGDGAFTWSGAAYDEKKGTLRIAHHSLATGRWELNGFSLVLTPTDGRAVRLLAIPQDDEKTIIKPDQMFLGGIMYKRRP